MFSVMLILYDLVQLWPMNCLQSSDRAVVTSVC